MGITEVGFFIAAVFLVVGCFRDAIPAIIIVGTTLEPLARSVNMHPVQFAVIGTVSLAFGLVTPPYGLCLMISCAVARVRLRYALKDTMIMLVPMLLVLAAIIAWPELPLLLPRLIPPEFLRWGGVRANMPGASLPPQLSIGGGERTADAFQRLALGGNAIARRDHGGREHQHRAD